MPYKIEQTPQIEQLYTIFLKEFDSDYKFHGEAHNFWELVCVLDGTASVAADDKVFTLTKGQAILHPPMQFHNFSSLDGKALTIAVFTFSGKNIPNAYNKVCQIEDISTVKDLYKIAKKTFNFYLNLWVKSAKEENYSKFEFIKRLELFLIKLSGNTLRDTPITQGALNYSAIVKTLQENITKKLSVKDIAKLCNMSEINLQKTFSRYAGVGIMEYFTRLRMQYATELLKGGKTVKETSLSLDFTDQNYFSTVYKRVTGHTPTQIKKS